MVGFTGRSHLQCGILILLWVVLLSLSLCYLVVIIQPNPQPHQTKFVPANSLVPTNKVLVGIFSNNIDGPSVPPSGPCLSYGETLEVSTTYIDCLWPEDVSWLWPRVIWARTRPLNGKAAKFVFLLMENH